MGHVCNVCRSKRGRGRSTNDEEFTAHLEGRTKFDAQRKLESFEEFYDINMHPTFFELACRSRHGMFEMKLVERVQQSRDVFLFTFEFLHGTDDLEEFDDVAPIEQWILGAKPGWPVQLGLMIDGQMVKR